MRRFVAALAGLCLLAGTAHAEVDGGRAAQVFDAAGFKGVALIGDGDAIGWTKASGLAGADSVWRLASVTKQFTALMLMQEVAAGRLDLDVPIKRYWPQWPQIYADKITLRMLMRHDSGLADPSESKAAKDGVPAFYRRSGAAAAPAQAATGFCAEHPRALPESGFHYNNCDFIVAGTLLERTTGKSFGTLLQERIAKPLGLKTLGVFAFDAPVVANVTGTVEKGAPEPPLNLGTYGEAGSAYITPAELWTFDRALMDNTLLDKIATEQMWTGEPKLGYAALGAWSFIAPLKGCPDPVTLIERRGAIGGVQVRNFIAPASHKAVILFSSDGMFDFGEVWQGSGFSHDMLAAALCPAP